MYPRNAASPPRIAIGAVVQISDGAVQSSGVSVVVRPEGGAESAGGGTIAYSAASGLVYYTPTQAETDYTAFCVIAYKASCLPVSQTVVTTASDTAGTAALDSAALQAIADSVLTRNVSNVEATADEHTLATAILSLLEWSISGGDLIIKRTDGTTTHYTKTLSSATGTGEVITGLN